MPTHPHNKAPTADRLVAGGGFSLDVAQRQNAFARQDTLYIGIADRSARPFVRQRPEGSALRRCPSARRPPFGARPAPRPCALRPSPCEKPAVFRFSPPLFREKPTFPKNAPAFCSLPSPTGSPPRPGHRGKISHRRGESAQKCACVHFFLFLLAFYAGKTRYICIENLFYQLRMAKSRRFVPVFVCPPECSHTFHPSL